MTGDGEAPSAVGWSIANGRHITSSATRALAVAALTRFGVRTESLKEFGSNAALRTAVLAGYGVAAISREAVADDLRQGG